MLNANQVPCRIETRGPLVLRLNENASGSRVYGVITVEELAFLQESERIETRGPLVLRLNES